MAERGQPGTWMHLVLWDGGEIDLAASRAELPANDEVAARLMARLLWPGQLHYVPGDKWWYVCSDDLSYHPVDVSGTIGRRIERFARMLARALEACRQRLEVETRQAMQGDTPAKIEAAVKAAWKDVWGPVAAYVATLSRTKGMRDLKGWLEQVTCGTDPADMVDAHPRLLNMANYTAVLDPQDGEPLWLAHDPVRMHTYRVEAQLSVAQDRDGALRGCPKYAGMLWRAAGESPAVFDYLIKVLGYATLGANPHHLVFFLSGPPRSGKTKLLEILSTVLGPTLAYEAKHTLLGAGATSRDETTMRGKRVITISETSERIHIDEAQLKRLTGQAWFAVSQLYDKTITRVPVTWLFVIDNNQMPKIDYMDEGLALRSKVIPMGPTIPPEQRDPYLAPRIIAEERDGIASMLVWACRWAMAGGGRGLLLPPAEVVRATDTYRAEQDTIGLWLSERCDFTLNGQTRAQLGSDCYRDFMTWCRNRDEDPVGTQTFYGDLTARQGIGRSGDAHHVWFIGFSLLYPAGL